MHCLPEGCSDDSRVANESCHDWCGILRTGWGDAPLRLPSHFRRSGVTHSSQIGVGLIGCGTVGAGVAKLLRDNASLYAHRLGGVTPVLQRVLVRDTAKAVATGLVPASLVTADADAFFATPDMPIVIEVAGGAGPISVYVRRALTAGKHVVTANKSLLASEGADLFALARKHHVSIAFEASCGGGIPIITAIQFGLMANRIDALYGILNGTCNYILTEMTQKAKSYATALKEAQDAGFAEADPTLDVSGRDAAQKLAVLASLAFGVRVNGDQVWSEGIDKLDLVDIRLAAELGYEIKLLAIGERTRGSDSTTESKLSLRVHPSFVSKRIPLAQVHGSFNALSVFGSANGHTMYYGRGAGQLPTASAIVGDLLNVASGWYPKAFASMNLWSDAQAPAVVADPDELLSRFYIRMNAMDVPGVMAKVSSILGEAGISLSSILQHEVNAGQFVPLVVTTHLARQGAVRAALLRIGKLSVIEGQPVCVRIVDLPLG
jgi:homoserine dehydrogenase